MRDRIDPQNRTKSARALTAERQSQLDGVQGETEHAEAAAKGGKRQDVWAAFMRAHGRINNVIGDVMQEMG